MFDRTFLSVHLPPACKHCIWLLAHLGFSVSKIGGPWLVWPNHSTSMVQECASTVREYSGGGSRFCNAV